MSRLMGGLVAAGSNSGVTVAASMVNSSRLLLPPSPHAVRIRMTAARIVTTGVFLRIISPLHMPACYNAELLRCWHAELLTLFYRRKHDFTTHRSMCRRRAEPLRL